MATARYNYDMPPMVFWNEVDLKIQLQKLAKVYMAGGLKEQQDMESDNGHTFSYSVMVLFPTRFQH
jgi:hypothetical protein